MEATAEKSEFPSVMATSKRGEAGPLGKGTPGSRLKSRRPGNMSLRQFARDAASGKLVVSDETAQDAKAWLSSKRPGGSDKVRAEKKARKQRIRDARAASRGGGSAPAPAKKGK